MGCQPPLSYAPRVSLPAEPALSEGSRVALLVPGSVEYVVTVHALLAHGVVPIPLDPRLTAHERDRVLAGLSPDLVVTDEDDLPRLRAALGPTPAGALPRARPMHVTSGTTGTPKGVWSGLLSDEHAAALVAEERDLWGFTADDVNLVVSPLYHSAPLRFALGTLLAGGGCAPRPVRPRGDHDRDRARPADVDVLRADPPPAALRPLGRHRLAGPVLLPAGRPRRRSLPRRT